MKSSKAVALLFMSFMVSLLLIPPLNLEFVLLLTSPPTLPLVVGGPWSSF
jgi:hypothetical protein